MTMKNRIGIAAITILTGAVLLLTALFPYTRRVQAEYRASKPRLRIEGGSSNPGTLGAAFDYAMRFELDPLHDAVLARRAFLGDVDAVANIDAVIVAAQIAQSAGDPTTVYRASWALALLTEVYRVGFMYGSPLLELRADGTFMPCIFLSLLRRTPSGNCASLSTSRVRS